MRLYWRPFEEEDKEQLEQWRQDYAPADLELPHGYANPGESTETIVITRDDASRILSLTGTLILGLDPLLRDSEATGPEVAKALEMAEAVLTFLGVKAGAVDAFIAVPESLKEYITFLTNPKRGYEVTAQHCVILRKRIGHPPATRSDLPEEVSAT
jgi:hypothetical protein